MRLDFFRRLAYLTTVTTQYLTDESGEKVAVVIPIADYDALMEDVADLASDILTCGKSGWPQGGEFHHHSGPGVGRFGGV